ncbi:RNA polymerase sigma-70 factor [Pontibacter sp. 13R65]|uniref:RNA polymerase sigma-70 factor n=1 Tax=Pontibacter sp. 13R65 TaxID=3127458 RepID=UPI00301D9766
MSTWEKIFYEGSMQTSSKLVAADREEAIRFVADSPDRTTKLAVDTTTVPDNEILVRQTFQSDPKLGCELLYRHYYKSLCSHATRFVYSKSIAEDLVSDVFCQFYLQGTFQNITTSYRTFLYKSVRNKAYNYLRLEASKSLELDQTYEEGRADLSEQPDSVLQYDELRQEVEAAINSLPPKCRKIYLMHRFEDKKYAEIATELKLSLKTVEAQLSKASKIIKKAIARNWIYFVLLLYSFC